MAGRKSRKPAPLSGWHAEDVKAAIRKRGQTLSGLSRKNRFCESYLRGVLLRPLPRGQAIIAKFLGTRPDEIWPERYAPNGTPKSSGQQ